MDEPVAEGYINHSPPPFPGLAPGREGLKQAFKIFWEATPGRHEIEDQIAEGDRVVTRLTAYGRHVKDLPGIAARGQELTMMALPFTGLPTARSLSTGLERTNSGSCSSSA